MPAAPQHAPGSACGTSCEARDRREQAPRRRRRRAARARGGTDRRSRRARRCGPSGGAQPDLVEELADVARLRGERRPSRREPVPAVAQRGAAARRVRDHDRRTSRERGEVAARERVRGVARRPRAPGARRSSPGSRGTTTSKPLRASTRAVAAFAAPEQLGHHAAFEEADAPAALAARGHERGSRARRRWRGGTRGSSASRRARARAAGGAARARSRPQALREREQRTRSASALRCGTTWRSASARAALRRPARRPARRDLRARALEQRAVTARPTDTPSRRRGSRGTGTPPRASTSPSGIRPSATPRIR